MKALLNLSLAFLTFALPAAAEDACAQPTPEAMAEAAGVTLPKLPWHVANIWWNYEKPVEKCSSLEVDITIDRDVPDTYNLYISPCGTADMNGMSFYGGLQTVGDGTFEKAAVTITVHRPEKPNGAAMVICPGGGYGGLVVGPEGHGIAKWLNGHGITGIVLEYRLPKGRSAVPLLDAQRAIRTARAKAKDWGIDPAKLGIIGFSAGGHLAATAATRHDDGDPAAKDLVERQGCRPDFAVLVYPVITMGESTHGGSRKNLLGPSPSAEAIALYSAEKQVTGKTSPTYLTHAVNDRIVPVSHSRSFHAALEEKKIPVEFLELPSGDHGLDGYKGPMWDAWQTGVLKWLAGRGVVR